jgi:biopolymer transport protein ExbB/TolQ
MTQARRKAKVSTGLVVAIVATAVVLVVLLITVSMRGRQRRASQQRRADRRDLREAEQRVGRAERDADIAREEADRRGDPDR